MCVDHFQYDRQTMFLNKIRMITFKYRIAGFYCEKKFLRMIHLGHRRNIYGFYIYECRYIAWKYPNNIAYTFFVRIFIFANSSEFAKFAKLKDSQ